MAIRAPDGANKNNLLTLPIGSMDFDNPKVYGDISITDGLVVFLISQIFLFTSSLFILSILLGVRP